MSALKMWSIDSLGWIAEYRIPFSQLPLARSAPGEPLVWGINFYRHSPHRGETIPVQPQTLFASLSHTHQPLSPAAPLARRPRITPSSWHSIQP